MAKVTCPACSGRKPRCVLCGGTGKVSERLAEIYLEKPKDGKK